MAKSCSNCGKQLTFRDSFVWQGKPICKACLNQAEGKEGGEHNARTISSRRMQLTFDLRHVRSKLSRILQPIRERGVFGFFIVIKEMLQALISLLFSLVADGFFVALIGLCIILFFAAIDVEYSIVTLVITIVLSIVIWSYIKKQPFPITKSCSKCGKIVPTSSQAGQRCPHCGVFWSN